MFVKREIFIKTKEILTYKPFFYFYSSSIIHVSSTYPFLSQLKPKRSNSTRDLKLYHTKKKLIFTLQISTMRVFFMTHETLA